MTITLHQDPEIAMSSVIGFMAVGRIVEWFSGHSEFLAACSYMLASVAAVVTIYYKIKNKGQ